jgi:phosphatidylglycerophosphatase C
MSPAVIVFDFDGTLTCRDSFLDFCARYGLSRPFRLLFLLLPLAPLGLLLALLWSRGVGGSVLLWAMTVGTPPRSFVSALKRYARGRLARSVHEPILSELTRHREEGHRVIIATGSLRMLVRELLAARGVGRVATVGTRLERCCGGWIAPVHCTGSVKVDALRLRYGVSAWACVYTNSFADRALMSRARNITLVCPSSDTLRRTTRFSEASSIPLRVVRPRCAEGGSG